VFVSKRCGRCREDLPPTAFSRAGAGTQHWCKACFKAHRQGLRAERNVRLGVLAARRHRDRLHRYVLSWLERHPCVDCGQDDPIVLEFDHVAPKTAEVATLVLRKASIKEIQQEIASCEVVCANCHRRRTARRAGWWRLDEVRVDPGEPRWRRFRNVRFLQEVLEMGSCVDCGLCDPVVLEFDHVGPKRCSVTRLAWTEYSLETIAQEIGQCEICCCNCHRRRTARRGDQFRHRVRTAAAANTLGAPAPMV
jgi:5-methylcytosine-specific restriction endonuclease McrA